MLALLPLGGAPDRRGRVGFDAGFDEGRQESSLWKCWLLLRFRGAVSVPETAARRGRGHSAAGRRIERGAGVVARRERGAAWARAVAPQEAHGEGGWHRGQGGADGTAGGRISGMPALRPGCAG